MTTEGNDNDGVLVYVDLPLTNAIAARLLGVLQSTAQGGRRGVRVNWLVGGEVASDHSATLSRDIRELLSEDLVYQLFPHITDRNLSVESIVPRLNTSAAERYLPGTAVSIRGSLVFPELDGQDLKDSPFGGVTISLPSYSFHGESCIVGELHGGHYKLPLYLAESSKSQVAFCHRQPIEATGILRWVPPYSPGGAASLNLALRCAALWLR